MKDYTNMTFTDNQIEQLIRNKQAIMDYIEREILPFIDQEIRVEFGGTHTSIYNWNKTSNYKFIVAPKNKPLMDYNSRKNYHIGILERFGTWGNLEDKKSPYILLPLIDYWQNIKFSLHAQKQMQAEQRDRINNFEV
jgi:hypothetical protein